MLQSQHRSESNARSTAMLRLADGYAAHARWWRPERPRGAVLYLHGIQSHGGWYESSAGRLADEGFAVLLPDRRGSGLNRQQRGHADSDGQCLQDTSDLLDALLNETGFAAAHIVGVSWGGKLAAVVAAARPEQVASVSLVAPGIFARVDLPRLEKFRVAMSLINERQRMFDIPLNDPRLFTCNPARVAYFERDELKLTQVTASFLLASRRLDRQARRLAASRWRGPAHLMLAGHDPIIDNERTRDWFRALPSPDRQISEYPDAYHTLEFEADPTKYFDDLAGWIIRM
jgi:alpha-beta hydrolase superfamily lysophospholipase